MRSLSARVGPAAAVAALTAAVAVVWSWPLLLHAHTHAPLPAEAEGQPAQLALLSHDQMYSISGAARNAAALLRGAPLELIHQSLCYPVPRSATLGEHMIELGLLGVPGYALSGSPVLAYNLAWLLLLVIAATGAFALVRELTGSAGAAVAAALLFAFFPGRIGNLVHPPVIGIHWMPWVLLGFERLLQSGRATSALGLAAAASLQAWVGAYPLLVLFFFAGPYGAVRLVQRREVLDARRVVLLGAAIAVAAGATAAALVPYASAAETWGVLRARAISLLPFADLLPGGSGAVGLLVLLLTLPLAFLRGPPRGPAPALVAGALVCTVMCTRGPYWPGGPELEGIYAWLARRIPLFGAVRAPAEIRHGVTLGLSLLAGLGLHRVLQRVGPRPGAAVAAAAALAILAETFAPAIAERIYQRAPRVALREQAPTPARLAAYAALEAKGHEGPVLDLPLRVEGTGAFLHMPRYTLMAGYHLRPVAACFSSYAPPSFLSVARMAARLPDARGVEELAASGFRNAVLHRAKRALPAQALLEQGLATLPAVEVVGGSAEATAYRFETTQVPHGELERLAATGLRSEPPEKPWQKPRVAIAVVNRGDRTFALPHPIAPLPARARWWPKAGGDPGPWFDVRFLPPLALAAGATDLAVIDLGHLPEGCACTPEVEVPALGWSLRAGSDV